MISVNLNSITSYATAQSIRRAASVWLCTSVLIATQAIANTYDEASNAYDAGDFATAFSIAQPLAVNGNPNAQYLLALMYDDGHGVELDDLSAIEWYTAAAHQGHISSQFNLAYMYDYGEGVDEDNKQAVHWYTQSAEQGDVSAQLNLALCMTSQKTA